MRGHEGTVSKCLTLTVDQSHREGIRKGIEQDVTLQSLGDRWFTIACHPVALPHPTSALWQDMWPVSASKSLWLSSPFFSFHVEQCSGRSA